MAVRKPMPLFDNLKYVVDGTAGTPQIPYWYDEEDLQAASAFLGCYTGSTGTFNAYRREVERLLHWSWIMAHKSIRDLVQDDIVNYIQFCQKPPKAWIGLKIVPRFIKKKDARVPNKAWHPFVATISKVARQHGAKPTKDDFLLSNEAIKEIFAILNSFYNYLLQGEYIKINPVALIRQKNKFTRKLQGAPKIRKLTRLQWEYMLQTAERLADKEPNVHERTLFIISILYSMYLRISELAANDRWVPQMNHFRKDSESHWWFTTVGKGNKERRIAVSDTMLSALERWREHLDLTPLPSPADTSSLLPKLKGNGPISNTAHIRSIVQNCFNQAAIALEKDNHVEEAANLREATVHWLRHTGISEDVKIRPREHVRDDAGHSSSAITDRYIDVELRERHASARKKPLRAVKIDDQSSNKEDENH